MHHFYIMEEKYNYGNHISQLDWERIIEGTNQSIENDESIDDYVLLIKQSGNFTIESPIYFN